MHATPITLTKDEQGIVDRIQLGWEIGATSDKTGRDANPWIQHGGAGNGGSLYPMAQSLFDTLRKKGVIERYVVSYLVNKYRLTAAARTQFPLHVFAND